MVLDSVGFDTHQVGRNLLHFAVAAFDAGEVVLDDLFAPLPKYLRKAFSTPW